MLDPPWQANITHYTATARIQPLGTLDFVYTRGRDDTTVNLVAVENTKYTVHVNYSDALGGFTFDYVPDLPKSIDYLPYWTWPDGINGAYLSLTNELRVPDR